MKSIKDIDCRVVRENNGEVSILLGYPMENLVDMFSDMLEEPKDNVRSWLRRELVPMTLEDLNRLVLCLTKAQQLAEDIKTAQDYNVRVVTNDCDCVEVSEAAEVINLLDAECLIIPIDKPWAGYPNRWGPEFEDSPCGSCGHNTEGDAMNSDTCVDAGCDGSFNAWKPPEEVK